MGDTEPTIGEHEKKIIAIAAICHAANREFCKSIGDFTQLEWAHAPSWQQESAVNGVLFHLEKPRSPAASHENWMAEKVADGWKYGLVKNPETKEHPCIKPFNELSMEQQQKDCIFLAIVTAFAMSPMLARSQTPTTEKVQ